MKLADFKPHIMGAEEALSAFLGTLLGEDVPLKIEPPEPIKRTDAKIEKMAHLVVLSQDEAAGSVAVLLEQPWLPMLSKAMLGEEMEIQDDGADDLVRELAGQGYGAIRNQLGAAGVTLPEVAFEILIHGNQIPDRALPDDLWKMGFTARIGTSSMRGVAFLPAESPEAESPSAEQGAGGLLPDYGQGQLEPMQAAPMAIAPAMFPDLSGEGFGGDGFGDGDNFGLLAEVELEVSVELGRRKLPLADVLRLTTGSVIELENLVGEPLEVYANGRLIAEGEAVVIDEQFGIRITRLASDRQRTRAFM